MGVFELDNEAVLTIKAALETAVTERHAFPGKEGSPERMLSVEDWRERHERVARVMGVRLFEEAGCSD